MYRGVKGNYDTEFKVEVQAFHRSSDNYNVIIDIDEVEVEFEVAELTQEQITNGHIEQLRDIKNKLKADTQMQLQSLDEQIESLLAIECKV